MRVRERKLLHLTASRWLPPLAALGATLALAAGCALFTAPAATVKFPRGAFALAYADLKAAQAAMAVRVGQRCVPGGLDPETCRYFERVNDQLGVLDAQVRRAILDPAVEVDWQAIADAMKLVVAIAMKFI